MKWLVILAMAAGWALAQSRGAKPAPKVAAASPATGQWLIESLSVEGNQSYSTAQILAVAELQPGQMAGKAEFEAGRARLIASGAFEMVGYSFDTAPDGKGYAAAFHVTELEAAYPIRFQELGAPDSEIAKTLRAHDPLFSMSRLPITQVVLDRYAKWIQEYRASKGINDKVECHITPNGADRFVIVFRPARLLPSVAQISFTGNSVVPQNVLREAAAGQGIGAPYTEEDFQRILDVSVRPVYEARGRVRVSFPAIRTEPVADVRGLHVFVTVDEGESYNLGTVAMDGPSPIDAAQLIKEADLKTGDVANFDRVRDGLDHIRQALRHAGCLDAKVMETRKIDDTKKTVDVTVHLDEGPLYTMGKLDITGLGLEGEAEIRRIWTIKEGKPFNPDYPDLFLTRVRQDGVFDHLAKTNAEVKLDYQKHSADVTLTFTAGEPVKTKTGRGGR
jgi:outer membrane protein insertion porin family